MRLVRFFILIFSLAAFSQSKKDERTFEEKLAEMYKRITKSIELIREQITQNQSAPFLANLYMELADYTNQKANVMYYLKMEAMKGDASGGDAEKKFSDVVETTKEAAAIYEKILKEFPKFKGNSRAMYSLAVAYKSIDERVKFVRTANELLKKHKGTEYAIKGQVLLGQYQFDNGVFDEALKSFLPLVNTKYAYEKNLAKYKIGLIKLTQGKHKEALKYFEEVALDKELKDDDNEKEVSLESKGVKSNLKREALIDSVRAYTEVFKDKGEPVKYYSRIAPTEALFQEVIEKLAYRYIQKKKYNHAVHLLRTLSERKSQPDKVLNIYKEVLLMIPLDQRVYVPVSEIRYVLKRYLQLKSFFKLDPKVKRSAYDFFEKQVRDLGTRSHDKGKVTKGRVQKYHFLKAIEFYDLYLAIFGKSENAIKIATNMGDVYFRLNNYLKCGDYYLRVYKGEFGRTKFKDDVIKNAIYCLQKDREYGFYELRRANGLLIEALNIYMRHDPSKRNDPKTNFSLAKAEYDQGFYNKAIGKLIGFMRKFPKTKYAVDAANLILDYYNVKSDFQGIIKASDRILALRLPNKELNEKVKTIQQQARLKKLQSSVQSSANFDGVATGKSYLEHAASIGNSELRNIALKKALEASKQEKDFKTFLSSARLIASKEKDPSQRYEIEASIAQEHVKMTNFKEAQDVYAKIINGSYGKSSKQEAYNQAMTVALALRDWSTIGNLYRNRSLSAGLPSEYKQQIQEQFLSLLESPVQIPGSVSSIAQSLGSSPEVALGLYKAGNRIPDNLRSLERSMSSRICSSQAANVCRWKLMEKLESRSKSFLGSLRRAPKQIGAVEKYANEFAGITSEYTSLEGGGDVHIDMLSSLKQADLYKQFSNYMKGVAAKNPSLKPVLLAKANESLASAKNFMKRCSKIMDMSKVKTPVNRYCKAGKVPSFKEALYWGRSSGYRSVSRVSQNQYAEKKKNLFANFQASDLEDIASNYLRAGNFHYAAAAATYALSMSGANTGNLNTIVGCSIGKLKLYNEASYYLNQGDSNGGLKERCLAEIR